MKLYDLRIGNDVYKVSGYDGTKQPHNVTINDLYQTEELEPIPLTEEWLIGFGFDNQSMYEIGAEKKDEIFVHLKNMMVYISDSRDTTYAFPVKCKYVHQLQNLYFALTGDELTIL